MLVSFLEGMDVHYPGHSRAVAALADMVTRKLGLAEEDRRQRALRGPAPRHRQGDGRRQRPPAPRPPGRGEPGPPGRAPRPRHLPAPADHPVARASCPPSSRTTSDGTGTAIPVASAGEQIPLGGRIVAVADAFDAMTRNPHRPSRSAAEALAEIEACAGQPVRPAPGPDRSWPSTAPRPHPEALPRGARTRLGREPQPAAVPRPLTKSGFTSAIRIRTRPKVQTMAAPVGRSNRKDR